MEESAHSYPGHPDTDRISPLLRPRSIVVVGVSVRAGSAGHNVVRNLRLNNFSGDLYLVGRSEGRVEDLLIHTSMDLIPYDIDLAIFTLPASGVREALESCGKRRVKAVVVFSSGFAESGNRDAQEELAAIARQYNITMLGPNCLGFTNHIDGVSVGFSNPTRIEACDTTRDPAVAVLSQSGGLAKHILLALKCRDIPTSYYVATGNEADTTIADLVNYCVDDPSTQIVVLYVEEFRKPDVLLAAAKRAVAQSKPIVLLTTGRSKMAKAAVVSHTGAMVGDYDVMSTVLRHAGIVVTESIDELIDTAEILARFPAPTSKGLGVLTFSGAFCALAHDFAESVGVDIPELSEPTRQTLASHLPDFIPPRNPLDLGTQTMWQPDLMEIGPREMLADPNLGSLVISVPCSTPSAALSTIKYICKAVEGAGKPVVFAPLGDRTPMPDEFMAIAREKRLILSRSADRSIRALANVIRHARLGERARNAVSFSASAISEDIPAGTLTEWAGKQLLSRLGITTPTGALCQTPAEAVRIAEQIGYPVVLKAQSSALAHKTEAGAVALNIRDNAALEAAWSRMLADVQRYQPDLRLDGFLVEKMSPRGVELVLGAKRDPQWGPVLVAGLGGVLAEALKDIRIIPIDLNKDDIKAELMRLRSAAILTGFRGDPPADLDSVVDVLQQLGRFVAANPNIREIEINPLRVHAQGSGSTALDVLVVAEDAALQPR